MKLIIIDRKAWGQHRSEFADFIHRVEKLIGNPPETEQMARQRSRVQAFGHQQAYPAIIQRYGKNPFLNDWT